MDKFAMTAIAASLAFANPTFAEDAHHPERTQEAKGAPAKATGTEIGKMKDNVKKMQSQLDRVARAKTDEERHKAMEEHMQTMQENMKMAHAMHAGKMDCPMMEGGKMGGMGMMGKGANPGAAPDHMQQMEKRMDMMQMMMEQMMRRQDGQAPMPMK